MRRIFADDQTLIDRLGLNDTEAFEELYRRYWYSLYVYCLKKLYSPSDAKIIVRDIFIDIWEKRHSLPSSFSISKHLYEEVRKTVIECLSKKLADTNTNVFFKNRLLAEFSAQALQAARIPVTSKNRVINKPSELMRQQSVYTDVHDYTALSAMKWLFHSFATKLSIHNLLSYSKN